MEHFYTLLLLTFFCLLSAQPPTGYYDTATGLDNFALKTALKNIIDEVNDNNGQPFHDTSVTYGQLWNLYLTSDIRNDGKIWDTYSQCNFTFGTDQDSGSGGATECDKYNREHTFARSWFGGNSNLAIFSDGFNVVPVDKKVNTIKGNLAFGEVASANYTSLNGSKRGTSSIAGTQPIVFEPADEYKGDFARGFFYVAVRYENLIAAWQNNDPNGDSVLDGSSDKVFEQWALDMLYEWHINDPVSQKEIDRNNAVFAHQDNRNPFIDNPQWVYDIWKTTLSTKNKTLDGVKIYPNPADNQFTVNLPISGNTSVEIYDVLGKIIKTVNMNNSSVISLNSFTAGVYFLRIKQGSKLTTKKLVVR